MAEEKKSQRVVEVLARLQTGQWLTAKHLAGEFGVSERTILRDIQDLATRWPITGQPGRGFRLESGQVLAPQPFTLLEAMALILGADFASQVLDNEHQAAARSGADRLLTAIKDPETRNTVARLRDRIRFVGQSPDDRTEVGRSIRIIRQALQEGRRVIFEYVPRYPSAAAGPLQREVDPWALVNQGGAWYLIGHDLRRKGRRNFRLDRARNVATLMGSVRPPPRGFMPRLEDHNPRELEIVADFDPQVVAWVRESQFFFVAAEQPGFEGQMRVVLRAHREDEVLNWLLSWGRHVRVVSPDHVREAIAAEAAAILAQHGPPRASP